MHSRHDVAVAGDVSRLLAFLGRHAVPGVETWDGATYARTLALPGGPGVATVRAADGVAQIDLHLTRPADADDALSRLGHLLGADHDPAGADAHLATDPVLAPLVALRPGLTAPGSVDHAETLLRTVIGQQVSLAGARAVMARVVAEHGTPSGNPDVPLLFPSCEVLARVDPTTLPMPRARGRAVVAVATALADHPAIVDDDEALLALPGVGPWTVAYTRLRTRRDPDVFLATDLAVRRQLEAMQLPGDRRSAGDRAASWAPYRTAALMHLWTDLLERREAA